MKIKKHATGFAIILSVLITIPIVLLCLNMTPSGLSVISNELVLNVRLGKGDRIPLSEISPKPVPEGLLHPLIRTNGMAVGSIRYGHFMNTETGQKLFLYIMGDAPRTCFEYNNLIYVVDDWRQ